MNPIFKITKQCMKLNKRRTMVTILGVIISVTMVSGVSTIVSSFMDFIRETNIDRGGDWYISYDNVPQENMHYLQDDEIESTIISSSVGYAPLETIHNPRKPYVSISSYEASCINRLPIQLLEGAYPQNEQEIMIPISLKTLEKTKYQVGDKVTFQVGIRVLNDSELRGIGQWYTYQKDQETLQEIVEKTYTITGIFDDQNLYQSAAAGYDLMTVFTDGNYLGSTYDVKVKTKGPSYAIFDYAEEKDSLLQSERRYLNSTLLMTYGVNSDTNLTITIVLALAIVGLIILIGSVSLIYNAFAISLGERSRYLGMLSSVGATKKQKRSSVYYEALIIGAIAIPLGFIFGYLGMWITFQWVNGSILDTLFESTLHDINLRLIIDAKAFIIAFLFSMLIILISAWIPAKRASKISPIDAIRQNGDRQIKKKHVKTLRMTRNLFSFEAELALKNMKRNKSRYRITLFSLIISIILFVSISSFQEMIRKSFDMATKDVSGNMEVAIIDEKSLQESETYIEDLMQVEGVSSVIRTSSIEFSINAPYDILGDEMKLYMQDKGYDIFQVGIYAFEDEVLKAYCDEIDADYQSLQGDELKAIVVNHVLYKDYHTYSEVELLKSKNGDAFQLPVLDKTGLIEDNIPIAIQNTTDITPPTLSNKVESLDSIQFIISMKSMVRLQDQLRSQFQSDRVRTTITYQAEDPYKVEDQLLEISKNHPEFNSFISNFDRDRKQQEQTSLFVSIFLYGFVGLILLISCANIFNTISTGVALRKQEFAMLKSVGITPKGFRKMLAYENIFYGVKALLYGIPISCLLTFAMYSALARNFSFAFFLPWNAIMITIIGIFLLVFITMLYSIHKVKHDNIVDTIKNESI